MSTTSTSASSTSAANKNKSRVLKPIYLANTTVMDDQALFRSMIHQLGEHEQVVADDNSQRLQWLSEWIGFYTKQGYSVVLVVDEFESLLLGGTDRLLYSVFDMMTDEKRVFHFFIVGGCNDPGVFSRLNKRVLSRLELNAFHLHTPSLVQIVDIVRAHWKYAVEDHESPLSATEGEWYTNLDMLLHFYEQSKLWQEAIENGADIRWFLRQAIGQYREFFQGRIAEVAIPVARVMELAPWIENGRWLPESLDEFDCVNLVALHKLQQRKGTCDAKAWRDVWREINAGLLSSRGQDEELTYRGSFEKLLRLGFVKHMPTEKAWEHGLVFFAAQDQVEAWIRDLRTSNKHSNSGTMSNYNSCSATAFASGSNAGSTAQSTFLPKNPLRVGFSTAFESWAKRLESGS
ncbi:unnamed protein product [Amoebophrya sp. A25]|nr:unnamed protein product [Amoebophrya sp. A25]|eukprot:GSA25T00026072001.1